ncbi:MAG: hypothetical protein H6702_20890 [Myxococcales bacterium]|nr:hypothetical protein [Myxococcales bacterium]
MKSPAWMILVLWLPLALPGCGDEFSNAAFEEDARYLAAAPSAQVLRIGGPAAASATAATGLIVAEPAELYVLTRQISLALNGLAFGLVHAVDRVVEQPPTERTPRGRAWAPAPHPLDPQVSRFAMTREGDGYTYALTQAPRGDLGAPVTVLDGQFTPAGGGAGPGEGAGELRVDLDAARAVGQGWGQGDLTVTYTVRDHQVSLALSFRQADLGLGPMPEDAIYRFRRAPDGAGVFDFAFYDEAGQLARLRSRWDATGAGRADAVIIQNGRPLAVSECWDTTFARVYGRAGLFREGDEATCAFPTREEPGDPVE